jgi:hypothetical protein
MPNGHGRAVKSSRMARAFSQTDKLAKHCFYVAVILDNTPWLAAPLFPTLLLVNQKIKHKKARGKKDDFSMGLCHRGAR